MNNNTKDGEVQSMSIKSTMEFVKHWITSGGYSDGRFMLDRLIAQQHRIRDKSLKKKIVGYQKLLTAQHEHLMQNPLDSSHMPPEQYISASLQLAWVYAGDGSISHAIGVIRMCQTSTMIIPAK